jgi:hypothetical protein
MRNKREEVKLETHQVTLGKRKKLPLLRDSLVLLDEVCDASQSNRDVWWNRPTFVQSGGGETLGDGEKGVNKKKEGEVVADVRIQATPR